MYKVLIVDDEKSIRTSLKTMIRWESEGFSADCSAKDGIDALKMVQKYHPHLIIVDIAMPNMNGIEFIKTVRTIGYKGEILILSNCQNFLYAVEGLRNHVCDYINKTDITPSLLSQCLSKVKYRLDKRFIQTNKKVELFPETDDVSVLADILTKPEETMDHVFSKPYVILNIFLSQKTGTLSKPSEDLTATLWKLITEYTSGSDSHVLLAGPASVFLVIPQQSINLNTTKSILSLTEMLQSHFDLYMDVNCGFVLSPTFRSGRQFQNLVKNLPLAQQQLLYHHYGKILKWEEYASCQDYAADPKSTIQKLKAAMKTGNFEECKTIFETAVLHLKQHNYLPARTIRFMEQIFDFTILHNLVWLSPFKDKLFELSNQFYTLHTLDEYIGHYHTLIDLLISTDVKISETSSRKEIATIHHYIQNNIHQKLSLVSIAQTINMSANYVSRLFKSETGRNLMNYINQTKMDHALFLLEDLDLPVHDIAFSLGFDEIPYFNRLFQKFCKMSPSAYRKLFLNTLRIA